MSQKMCMQTMLARLASWARYLLPSVLGAVAGSLVTKALKDKSKADEAKSAAESKNAAGQGDIENKFELNNLLSGGKDVLSEADNALLSLLVKAIGEAHVHAGTYVTNWSPLFKSLRGLFDDAKDASAEDVAELRCKVACVLLTPCLQPDGSSEAKNTKLQQMCLDLQVLDGALVSATTFSEALGTNIRVKYSKIAMEWQMVNGAIASFSGAVVAAAGCYLDNDGLTRAGTGTALQGACRTVEGGTGLAQLRARLTEIQTHVATIDHKLIAQQASVRKHQGFMVDNAVRLDQYQGPDAALQAAIDALRGVIPRLFKHDEVARACASFEVLAHQFANPH